MPSGREALSEVTHQEPETREDPVTPRVTGHPAAQGLGPRNPEWPCPLWAEVIRQANKVLYLGGECSSSP